MNRKHSVIPEVTQAAKLNTRVCHLDDRIGHKVSVQPGPGMTVHTIARLRLGVLTHGDDDDNVIGCHSDVYSTQ